MSTELNKENVGEKEIIGFVQHQKHGIKEVSNKKDLAAFSSGGLRKPLGKLNNDNKPGDVNQFFGQGEGFKNICKSSTDKTQIYKDKIVPTKEKKETPKINPTKNQRSQTELSGQDLVDFQNTISPDVEFYKELAEKRREALNESLKENEELHIENEEQKEEIETLKQSVEKAKKIIDLISPCLFEEDNDEGDKEAGKDTDDHANSENLEKDIKDSCDKTDSLEKEDNCDGLKGESEGNDN